MTRLGHPNPIGHEHHKSVWFGHQSVAGINFWEDQPSSDIRIRHRCVRLYHDGNRWGGLVADLDWWAQGRSLFHHELILVIEPISNGGFALDLQSRLDSSGGVPVELGKTNFGFLGVRVARTMSEQFGGGRLMDAKGSVGESSARSASPIHGSTTPGRMLPPRQRGSVSWTIPSNPGHPVRWHVRADGWMGASFNRESAYGVAHGHPLVLRYRLLVHPGQPSHMDLGREWEVFAATPAYSIIPPHRGDLAALVRSHSPV